MPPWWKGGKAEESQQHRERKKDSIAFPLMGTSTTIKQVSFFSFWNSIIINLSFVSSLISNSILQTSIFTPSYGTPTKVRISSRMTTNQVIEQLLHKFKVNLLHVTAKRDLYEKCKDPCIYSILLLPQTVYSSSSSTDREWPTGVCSVLCSPEWR